MLVMCFAIYAAKDQEPKNKSQGPSIKDHEGAMDQEILDQDQDHKICVYVNDPWQNQIYQRPSWARHQEPSQIYIYIYICIFICIYIYIYLYSKDQKPAYQGPRAMDHGAGATHGPRATYIPRTHLRIYDTFIYVN